MSKGVFVITGASRGLGRTLAFHAVEQGYPVALLSRNIDDLKKVKAELVSKFGETQKISVHQLDLTDSTSVNKTFKEIEKDHNDFEVLVNNVGAWFGPKTISKLTTEEVAQSLNLNFFTAFNATKCALRIFEDRKSQKMTIINIGATASLQGWDELGAFCIGKGALRFFSQSLAREMGPKGIHVAHVIIDGVINNERTKKLNMDKADDKFIDMDAISRNILTIISQDKNCWTFELDLRPYNENW